MKTKRILPFVLAAAMLLSACGGNSAAQSGEGAYTAGTYTGEGQGYGGTVTVTITTDANSILEVTAEGADETPTVGGAALEELAAQVKEAQSAEIDGVTGATLTSNGVKAAAQAAIDAAMGKEAESSEKAAVADGTYFAHGFDNAYFVVVKGVENKLNGHFVVGHVLRVNLFLAVALGL